MKSVHRQQLLVTALCAVLYPSFALAQAPVPSAREGYLLDSAGNFVHSANPAQCWRTSSWTPALAQEPCDAVIRKVAALPVPVPAPAPVAATPAPVAAAVVAPVPVPLPVKVSLSTDTLFGFDKSTITEGGELLLNDLAMKIGATSAYEVTVIGHTDRIGTTKYNEGLSMRRANAVRDQLIAHGVAAGSINTSGRGESDPQTELADCKGPVGAKLIACLQPDRRVEVELKGTTASK